MKHKTLIFYISGGSKLYLQETGIRITDVDKEKYTAFLIVNGSYVEAVFTPNANPDVFDNVKQILIKSMLATAI